MQTRLINNNNNNDSGFDFEQFKKKTNANYLKVLAAIAEINRIDKLASTDKKSYLEEVIEVLDHQLFKNSKLKRMPRDIRMQDSVLKMYALFKAELSYRAQCYLRIHQLLKSNLVDDVKLIELRLCLMLAHNHLGDTQDLISMHAAQFMIKTATYNTLFNGDDLSFPALVTSLPESFNYLKLAFSVISDPKATVKTHTYVIWDKFITMVFSVLVELKAMQFAPDDHSIFALKCQNFNKKLIKHIKDLDPEGKGQLMTLESIHDIVIKLNGIYPLFFAHMGMVIQRQHFHEIYGQCLKTLEERRVILEEFANGLIQDGAIPTKIMHNYVAYYEEFTRAYHEFWQPFCDDTFYFNPRHFEILEKRYNKDLESLYHFATSLNKHQLRQIQWHHLAEENRSKKEEEMRQQLSRETQQFVLSKKLQTDLYKATVAQARLQNSTAKKTVHESQASTKAKDMETQLFIDTHIESRIKRLGNAPMQTLIDLVQNTGAVKFKAAQALFEALGEEATSNGGSHFKIELPKLIVSVPEGMSPDKLSDSQKLSHGGMFFPHGSAHTSDLPWSDRRLIRETLSNAGITEETLIKMGVLDEAAERSKNKAFAK